MLWNWLQLSEVRLVEIKNINAMDSRSVFKVELIKSDEGSLGFSLLGKFAGIPHVIYDVIEDSPAADCEVSTKIVKWEKN